MAKRRAAEQITKDAHRDSSGSDEELENGFDDVQSRIAARKIAIPKSRLNKLRDVGAAPILNKPFGALAQNSQSTPTSASPFSFLGKGTTTSTAGSDKLKSDKELKTRALNANFAAQIAKANTNSPFESWLTMCEKYIEYSRKIAKESASPEGTSPVPEAPKLEQSGSATKSQITSTGFQFGGSNVASATTFQFGDKKIDFSKPAAPSKPAGGFVFNPQGGSKIVTKPEGDDSNMSVENSDAGAKPSGAFTFNESKKEAPSKPTFSFGTTPSAESSKSLFKSAAPASSESAPFSFGTSGTTASKEKPAFSFGASTSSSSADNSKPKFSFDWGAGEEKSSKPSDSGPLFGGKSDTTATKLNAPNVSGSKPTTDSRPEDAKTTSGSLGADSPKPFQFGSSNTSETPRFSFGGATSNAPKSTPAFTFGSTSSANNPPPKFSFGAASDGTKPAFSFGTGSNPFASSAQSSEVKQDASWKPSNPVKIVDDNTASHKEQSNEPSEEQNDPQTDLGGPGPGEENEDNVYEKKSKVFEQVDGEYKTLGLGMLRVLVHKETKKARALVRAEGSGRVLLNVPIRKVFEYTTIGKGQVKLMDVKPGEQTPSTYVLRVKTEEDGNELKTKLEEVKN